MNNIFTKTMCVLGLLTMAALTTQAQMGRSAERGNGQLLKPDCPVLQDIHSEGYVATQWLNSLQPAWQSTIRKASGSFEDVLVLEDFSGVTYGSVPDLTQEFPNPADAINVSETSYYVRPDLMQENLQWASHNVYAANGAVYFYNPSMFDTSWLETPLGDYSGDLTVTFRVKALNHRQVWETDKDGNIEWSWYTGSTVSCSVNLDGFNHPTSYVVTNDGKDSKWSNRIYSNQGWHKVTFQVRNFSPNDGGHVRIQIDGAAIVDDIEVSAANTIMPAPVVNGVTDFQEDHFTISWQPVRRAYNYLVDLWKKTSTGITGLTEDFENFNDKRWKLEGSTIGVKDGEGVNGSKGMVLYKGDQLTTPNIEQPYATFKFHLRVVDPTAANAYQMHSEVKIDGLTAEGKWNQMGTIYCWNLGGDGDWTDNTQWKGGAADNKYYALRFRTIEDGGSLAGDWAETEYLVIDDFTCTVDEPGLQLERVWGNPKLDYGEDNVNTCYARSIPTEYTFNGLDPNAEYYYGVRAFYMGEVSTTEVYHAFGCATPKILDPTDIDERGSFTANWKALKKCSGYYVNLYGVRTAQQDQEFYPVMEEYFNKITEKVSDAVTLAGAVKLTNLDETSLDDYTDTPGWRGKNNILAKGMLGCAAGQDDKGYIKLPTVEVSNADEYAISLQAFGVAGDYLLITLSDTEWYSIPFADNGQGMGVINGTYILPTNGNKTVNIQLDSYNYLAFVINDIEILQDVKKGDRIYTWLQKATCLPDETSYEFTGLDDYDYGTFAYDLTGYYNYGGKMAVSTPSERKLVVLDESKSAMNNPTAIDLTQGSEGYPCWYTVDGQRLDKPSRGVNIVRHADGTTRKVIVK